MVVKLSKVQKKLLCITMAQHLPTIRDLLNLNQKQFSSMSGISTDRLSRIENEHVVMTWSQFLAIIAICDMNQVTKEYLYVNHLLPREFVQYIQRLDDVIPPDYNTILREEVIQSYNELKGDKDDVTIW